MSRPRPVHDCTVVPVATGSHAGLAGYRAACSCGHKGPTLSSRADAQVNAVEHAVGHPVTQKPAKAGGGWPSGN
jgi:hypothetical protein